MDSRGEGSYNGRSKGMKANWSAKKLKMDGLRMTGHFGPLSNENRPLSRITVDRPLSILVFSPYGNGPITSAEDDLAALEKLKPKTYKAMEDPHFMKSKYKSLYAPIKCTVSNWHSDFSNM